LGLAALRPFGINAEVLSFKAPLKGWRTEAVSMANSS